ncbi:PREDICTED: HIRA-interacting protein 3-like isoform X1 [Trachymyrmex cornetzi]|uniref:HIRA-interacting protein 3-like isoform X1 n=2 Tax=Trachymyrmex cornetzi TaxID=471704 RepID=UPI00084ED948|nr:PREDICTED: HIRA-interacting protein 3-like isoform X1 [Trachymyrmex cornetzi]XP_018363422.1 PREDICTED: HIRA-interacting protein 3-like isoform X1 [Trachymyrmex cornetzi]
MLNYCYKMIESDHSEIEGEDMDRLQLSSTSVDDTPKKRPRDSEDEIDLSKKRQCLFNERSEILESDNSETVSEENNTERCHMKLERYKLYRENRQSVQEVSLSESDMDGKNKEKQGGNLKQENERETENNITLNKNPGEININYNIKEEIVESMDNSFQKSITNASVMSIPESKKETTGGNEVKEENGKTMTREENNKEDEMKKRHTAKKCTVDTEVVDGLELSVECASDREESSSENEDEKDVKPRPKTIIVNAEPNESELDCSSEEEKPDLQQIADTLKIKSEKSREKAAKKKGSRTSFSKLKTSGSEDSQNNNSDEDYSPRTKKKMTKSPATRKSTDKHRSVESKRGRGKDIRNSHPKNTECLISDDEDTTAAEKANKTTTIKNGLQGELSNTESSSKDESDNNSEKEERSMKSGRGSRGNDKGDKQIQRLKKYLKVAGVKVQSYNRIWADCRNNTAKVNRLKELLKKNGVSGKLSLEKCKRVREKNEKMKEVSELDMSNIISEGRITRARRSMDTVKKTVPDTPPRYREHNTFRRIQTVVDSDSE